MSKDPLLQPYRLKHLTLRNRLMTTAHEPNYSEDGMPKERYRLYHLERAKGGVALTMTAGSAVVSRDSAPAFGNLLAYKDEIVPHLKRLADACHEEGAAVMIQLTHLGRRTNWNHSDWLPVLAPSPVREPAHRAFPKEMEDWDIERIVADYATAAQRIKAAGLDGLELECYGHLIDGFWSPATNRREDDYNGDLDARLRFAFLVYEAIREAVGPDFIVGSRLVADEDWEKGLSREEGVEICRRLAGSGLIDFLNVIRGHIETDVALSQVIPVGGMRSAPHLDFAGEVRAETGFPVFHAARIPDVATARHAIAEGKLDMVGMTRAHIAEPHIGRKVREGREEEIRPCVGATYCLDRIYEGHEALCIHNPATGREAWIPHEVPGSRGAAKKVVVVGAGPAGLEAARVAATRGHKVVLFEAASEAGGQVRLLARNPRRSEMIGIIDWRVAECERLGVTLAFNRYVEAAEVQEEEPEVVILATGGLPNFEALEGGDDLAVSSWDILSGDVKPGGRVLLYDDNGAHAGMQAAEAIARAGAELEIISPERFFAPEVGGLNHAKYAECFAELGVRITISSRLLGIEQEGNALTAIIGSDYAARRERRAVDQVVIEGGTAPLDGLYWDLKPLSANLGALDQVAFIGLESQGEARNREGRFHLYRIGDAVAGRNIHAAIYDALRLCLPL